MSTVKDDAESISDAVVYVNIPSALETISVMTLLTFGFLFGTLVTVLFIYQTQNLMKGQTSTERTRQARLQA